MIHCYLYTLIAHVLAVLEEEDGEAGDNTERHTDEYEDGALKIVFFIARIR